MISSESKHVTRITMRGKEESFVYVHEGDGIETTRNWLDSLAKVDPRRPSRFSPLVINGMIKTGERTFWVGNTVVAIFTSLLQGKTCWLTEILPAFIQENKKFGNSSGRNQALIVSINCEQLNHQSAHGFLSDLLSKIQHKIEESLGVTFPDRLKPSLSKKDDLESFKMPLADTIEYISCNLSQRVFFLLDEIQKWFSWSTSDARHGDESTLKAAIG